MDAAKRDRELVRHFSAECTFLSKSDVMRVRRLPAAHRARLSGDEADVILVAMSARLHQSERAFIDGFGLQVPERPTKSPPIIAVSFYALARCQAHSLEAAWSESSQRRQAARDCAARIFARLWGAMSSRSSRVLSAKRPPPLF